MLNSPSICSIFEFVCCSTLNALEHVLFFSIHIDEDKSNRSNDLHAIFHKFNLNVCLNENRRVIKWRIFSFWQNAIFGIVISWFFVVVVDIFKIIVKHLNSEKCLNIWTKVWRSVLGVCVYAQVLYGRWRKYFYRKRIYCSIKEKLASIISEKGFQLIHDITTLQFSKIGLNHSHSRCVNDKRFFKANDKKILEIF